MCLTEFDVESAIKTWREDGYDEGRQDKALEAARNLLKMNLGTFEQISQATKLPLEAVRQLAEELATEKA